MKYFTLSLFSLLLLFTACLDSSGPSVYDDSEDLVFLEEYGQQNNVTTTESGLMYRVIEEGDGITPGANEVVVIDIRIEHVTDDEVVLNSFDSYPEMVPLKYITTNLTGLKEAVQLMKIGADYELVMPSQLAFNDGRVYRFRVELQNTQELYMQNFASQEGVTITDSGLMYRVIEEGEGEKPTETSTVTVDYIGTFINGAEFDSDESVPFDLDGPTPPIEGFSEGLQLMTPGSTYEFLLPGDLAYGDNPPATSSIYPGAALTFEVKLISFE